MVLRYPCKTMHGFITKGHGKHCTCTLIPMHFQLLSMDNVGPSNQLAFEGQFTTTEATLSFGTKDSYRVHTRASRWSLAAREVRPCS